MADYMVDIKEQSLFEAGCSGCLSVFLWDCITFIGASCVLLTSIHIVFRILIGIAICIAFFFALKIPYVGKAVHICFGLFWGWFIFNLIGVPRWSFVENDPIWYWTIQIILWLVFIPLHIMSSKFNP